jgi:hypothetical protein
VRDFSPFNFGLVVAYLVPGFVILWGLSLHSATVAAWLATPSLTGPSVGDLFYAMLASVACGMFANLVRWAVIDTIHHGTGVRIPAWDFSRLQERLGAYQLLIELHYKHYQYAANMLVAVVFASVAFRSSPSGWETGVGTTDVGIVFVCVVLFLGSRDALRKYYRRAGELLSSGERR